jgi:IclR helix-turn-helix domain.
MCKDTNPERLLSAVSDDRFRHILAAIAKKPLTVGEIAGECDLPQSTVYRRVQSLTDDNLVEQTLRVHGDGCHSKEYGLYGEGLSASMEVDGSIEIEVFCEVTEKEQESEELLHPSP